MTAPSLDIHADGLPAPRRYFAIAVLLITLVLVVLDSAIANVALPSIAASLNADPSDVVWVISSYQLAVLVALLPCGAIGEMLGPRRAYLAGIAVFTVASAACAFSVNLPMLVAARALQGLGGGAIMALATMNMRFSVPQRMLGTIIGMNAMTVAISLAAGPGIAGAILAVADWPWLFLVNLPVGALALTMGWMVLGRIGGTGRRLDLRVLAVNSLMFVLFFYGADRVTEAPWMGGALMAAAVVALVVLLRLERGVKAPLVPTDLFAEPAFRIAVIASVCCFTGQMLSMIALPFYFQHALGMTPSQTGLYMMPWPIAVAVIAPISGKLSNRYKTATLCAVGGGMLAAGLAAAGLLPAGPQGLTLVLATVLAGFGFGLFQTPNNRILLLSVPKTRSGAAGAMQGTARLTGQTFGAIIMALMFGLLPVTTAPGTALVVAGGFAALAALVSASRARYEVVG